MIYWNKSFKSLLYKRIKRIRYSFGFIKIYQLNLDRNTEMKITYKQINDAAVVRQNDTKQDNKDLMKWGLIWWFVCIVVSILAIFTNGIHFLTISLIALSIFLVRIGNLLCEISVNIRTTLKQNDDIRLLILANTSLDES